MTFSRESNIDTWFEIDAENKVKDNDHHKAEAMFKGLAAALNMAVRFDEKILGTIRSTKGQLD